MKTKEEYTKWLDYLEIINRDFEPYTKDELDILIKINNVIDYFKNKIEKLENED